MRAVLILVAVTLSAPDADACSCIADVPIIAPADGATGVPTNARVFVTARGEVTVELRDHATGATVALAPTPHTRASGNADWTMATPAQALAADTQYDITVTVASQVTASTFTTGNAADLDPPAAVVIDSLQLESMAYPTAGECASSCVDAVNGRVSYVAPELRIPADAVIASLTLTHADGTPFDEVALPAHQELGFRSCEPQAPALEPSSDYCATVTVYDLAGNTSVSEGFCTATVDCEPVQRADCEPAFSASNACWPVDVPMEVCSTSNSPSWMLGLLLIFVPRRARPRRPR